MLRKFFVAVALIAFAVPAQAGVFGTLITDGRTNQLQDDNFEILVNAGGEITDPGTGFGLDNSIDIGDYLVGMVQITGRSAPIPPAADNYGLPDSGEAAFTGIFALKVADVTVTGSNAGIFGGGDTGTIVFEALTSAEWDDIGLVDLGFAPTGTDDGTVAILYDDPDGLFQGGTPPLAVEDALATVDGTKLWEFGLGGGFWEAQNSNVDISEIPAVGAGGTFNAGLNVTTTHPAASGLVLLDVIIETPAGPVFLPFDLFLQGSTLAPTNTNFDALSDTDFFIRPVPEPSSFAVFAMLAGGAVASRRRRSKKA